MPPRRFEKPFEHEENSRADKFQGHLVAASGEFCGTFLFLYMAFANHLMAVDQAGEKGPNGGNSAQTVVYIAFGYGFSLLVNVWAFYRISGGLFNPAVTLGLVLSGAVPAFRGLVLLPAQIIAAMCAAGLVSCMFPGNIATVNTTLSPQTSIAQGVFIEMFLTMQLLIVILMVAAEKSKDTFLAPVAIGLALFVAELAGVYYTGGSLNPARSFGPAVASRHFPGYHWIYWVGPCMGAMFCSGYYRFAKFFNYEEANPGQDSAGGHSDD